MNQLLLPEKDEDVQRPQTKLYKDLKKKQGEAKNVKNEIAAKNQRRFRRKECEKVEYQGNKYKMPLNYNYQMDRMT